MKKSTPINLIVHPSKTRIVPLMDRGGPQGLAMGRLIKETVRAEEAGPVDVEVSNQQTVTTLSLRSIPHLSNLPPPSKFPSSKFPLSKLPLSKLPFHSRFPRATSIVSTTTSRSATPRRSASFIFSASSLPTATLFLPTTKKQSRPSKR